MPVGMPLCITVMPAGMPLCITSIYTPTQVKSITVIVITSAVAVITAAMRYLWSFKSCELPVICRHLYPRLDIICTSSEENASLI